MNIAVFGGSFDPPHLGHEAIVNEALKILQIDKLIIVPTYLNPFKDSSHFNSLQRLELVSDIFKNNNKIKISDYEIMQKKAVTTIETIKYLKIQHPNIKKIYLIIGADNLSKLHLWKDYNELKTLVTFIIATRNNIKNKEFQTLKVNYDISSTKIRENLDITLISNKIKQKVKKLWKID